MTKNAHLPGDLRSLRHSAHAETNRGDQPFSSIVDEDRSDLSRRIAEGLKDFRHSSPLCR